MREDMNFSFLPAARTDPERKKKTSGFCILLIQNHHVPALMQIELFYFAPPLFAVFATSKYKRFLSFPQEDNKTEANQ